VDSITSLNFNAKKHAFQTLITIRCKLKNGVQNKGTSSEAGSQEFDPDRNPLTALPLSAIKPAFFNLLRQFEPFGPGNSRPVFLSRGGTAVIESARRTAFVLRELNPVLRELNPEDCF
jgi:single-stranded DNA-specific DHH superfamily exonuclease